METRSAGPSAQDITKFREDGYLVLDRFIDPARAGRVADRFGGLFRGEFETTVPPDEWRWVDGRDPRDVTRMIWNGWKSDLTVAELALDETIGRWCAALAGWSGTRLNQDGCLWKPANAAGLAFHQDASYNRWVVPNEVITCWIALDDATPDNGAIEYVRGSHRWGIGPKPLDFHKPSDHRAVVRDAAESLGVPLEITTVRVPRGGVSFHHGWLWHGSGPNVTNGDRRVLAIHAMHEHATFHPSNPAYAQGRYRRFDSTAMDESHYPVTFGTTPGRSKFIASYIAGPRLEYKTHAWTGATDK